MFRNTSKLISKNVLKNVDSVPYNIFVTDNVFRNILDEYNDTNVNIKKNNILYNDYTVLKSYDKYRLMFGVLPPKECTYYHFNRHIKIIEGDIEIRFNTSEINKFKFDKKNALTIASPHYMYNNNNIESSYIWIEKTPQYQNSLII